ncbi:hypothetical protein ABMC89_10360 [Sulfitobacter sp. HNIBRBA3233]|uniref:hypothetical protein n=1 Tax=Sulfitobacter marinivivus TaxID=3158558 RepID=UPI0032DFA2FC
MMLRAALLVVLLIGGSGARADETPLAVGIFGVVERTDPLVVAGRAIANPEAVKPLSPLGPDHRIAVGDTLAIRATLENGLLHAQRILAVFAVAGPVEKTGTEEARVMGTRVHIPPSGRVDDGTWAAFSGLWSGGKVITTRLTPLDANGIAMLTGVFADIGEAGLPVIGGSTIIGATLPDDDTGADVWLVTGTPAGEGLRVQLMSRGIFGGPVDLEIWEGYASGPVASETWALSGTPVLGYDREAQMPQAGTLLRVCARAARVLRAPPMDAPEDLTAAFGALGCAQTAAVSGG